MGPNNTGHPLGLVRELELVEGQELGRELVLVEGLELEPFLEQHHQDYKFHNGDYIQHHILY